MVMTDNDMIWHRTTRKHHVSGYMMDLFIKLVFFIIRLSINQVYHIVRHFQVQRKCRHYT